MAHWLDTAVFYEIYPQSFRDANGDGIGDLRGIIEKLDYVRHLGADAIWLNPCYDSPFFDAGYDVRDHFQVAPRYGTNAEMKELFDRAHELGMHVLLDLVPGHTSIDHPWFRASCLDEKNEYSDRYIWRTTPGPRNTPYHNIAGFLVGLSERRGGVAVNCFSTQPALNYGFGKVSEPWQLPADHPEAEATRQAIQDVMEFWLSMGCDGFRVDMAQSLVKEDEDRTWTKKLWRKMRAFLDEHYPEAVLVSEWGNPAEALDAGFHMDFLLHNGPSHYMDLFREKPFFSAEAEGDVAEFARVYTGFYEKTRDKGLICIPSGNHDMARIRDTLTPEEMKLAFAFLLTMPGCPFLYYGDEIGMRHLSGLKSKEGGYERTGARTPMQWDDGPNAGFSVAAPHRLYLPVDPSPDRPTVAAQEKDPQSLLRHIRGLIEFRREHPALRSNTDFRFLYAKSGEPPLLYERSCEEERLVVAINPSKEGVALEIGDNALSVLAWYGGEVTVRDRALRIPGQSFAVLEEK